MRHEEAGLDVGGTRREADGVDLLFEAEREVPSQNEHDAPAGLRGFIGNSSLPLGFDTKNPF